MKRLFANDYLQDAMIHHASLWDMGGRRVRIVIQGGSFNGRGGIQATEAYFYWIAVFSERSSRWEPLWQGELLPGEASWQTHEEALRQCEQVGLNIAIKIFDGA